VERAVTERNVDPDAPRLWVCYKFRDGRLRVDCLLYVPEGEAIDRAHEHARAHGGQYVYCSREREIGAKRG
jgi:hypothetical protein